MHKFNGFPPGKQRQTWLPEMFFTDLLPLIDDLAELKVTLFSFQALNQKEGEFRYLRLRDFANDAALTEGLRQIDAQADVQTVLHNAVKRVVERGTLLTGTVTVNQQAETLYFANTPQGRKAVEQIQSGKWQPGDLHNPIEILPSRPNIYQLYEANIGSLTPLLADELKDAEVEYPDTWLEESFKLAVEHNKRNWRYIRAILERWDREGKDRGLVEKRAESDGAKYISGEFAAFIKYKPDE